ncbi:hypothetical protein RHSIM_Rhsim02G0188900 [Rhododendron simsii]|uniref:Uncharacterized protein n=1 Tax=Rhododendron simsii TaxID=118357 RepID=A0A834HGL1_RHOSS|nr:hypothetical protein RHSIM_Rhsim02G0188900 [Rhododendron simsii]
MKRCTPVASFADPGSGNNNGYCPGPTIPLGGYIVKKLEKVALAVQAEQKNCDAVKKRYAAAIVEQRSCYSLLKDLQVSSHLRKRQVVEISFS